MRLEACVRGCVVRGVHFAVCPDFGRTDGECGGCVPVEPRDGVMLCARCYGRLRRAIATAPELLEHLRERIQNPVTARQYRHDPANRSKGSSRAPVDVTLLDAIRDILGILNTTCDAAASPAEVRRVAEGAVNDLLLDFDLIANDATAIDEWWPAIMSIEIEGAPDFWTINRAAARWPLDERRRYSTIPCPDCDFKAIIVHPPRHVGDKTWYTCTNCEFDVHEDDDAGAALAIFGPYDPTRPLVVTGEES